ncbi:UBN2 domain-containing protein [Gossypium australe]|uniref:UBN2 domain-containing protein n=1 Tax=Gossypium australe TaxID=47621 RepID=A0A5B6W293_9ROSI|nr:UBN2 domain-containing protein [Gossypium australe]
MTKNNNTVSVSQPVILVFNGDNYEFWSIKMKTLFKSQELWDLVENRYPDDDGEAKLRENQKRDNKALFFIQQATLQMKSGESVQDYLTRAAAVLNQMKSYGEQVMDQTTIEKSHEARLNRINEKSDDKAFQVMGEPPKQQDNSRIATYRGGYCGRGGRGRGRGAGR